MTKQQTVISEINEHLNNRTQSEGGLTQRIITHFIEDLNTDDAINSIYEIISAGDYSRLIQKLNDSKCTIGFAYALKRFLYQNTEESSKNQSEFTLVLPARAANIKGISYQKATFGAPTEHNTELSEFEQEFFSVFCSQCAKINGFTNWTKAKFKRLFENNSIKRDSIFELGFALKMNASDVSYFLTDVAGENPYNLRCTDELIYYFCASNPHYNDMNTANAILESYKNLTSENDSKSFDKKIYTFTQKTLDAISAIQNKIYENDDAVFEDFCSYMVKEHAHMNGNSRTALGYFETLFAMTACVFYYKFQVLYSTPPTAERRPEFFKPYRKEEASKNPSNQKIICILSPDIQKRLLVSDGDAFYQLLESIARIRSTDLPGIYPKLKLSGDFIQQAPSPHDSPYEIDLEKFGRELCPIKNRQETFLNEEHIILTTLREFPDIARIRKILKGDFAVKRTDIIYLSFLLFSYRKELSPDSSPCKIIQEFMRFTDAILASCRLSPLYLSNPFDRFLLTCLSFDEPFDLYCALFEYSYSKGQPIWKVTNSFLADRSYIHSYYELLHKHNSYIRELAKLMYKEHIKYGTAYIFRFHSSEKAITLFDSANNPVKGIGFYYCLIKLNNAFQKLLTSDHWLSFSQDFKMYLFNTLKRMEPDIDYYKRDWITFD